MPRTTKQATPALGYRTVAQAAQLPSRPICEWTGDDLAPLEDIHQLMKYLSRRIRWWQVWLLCLALPRGKRADREFRRWWRTVTSLLDTGGFWAAIFERQTSHLVVHVFFGYPDGQDPVRFLAGLLARLASAHLSGADIKFAPNDYHPKRGLTPHLQHIKGPTVLTVRTKAGIGWSPPAT